jgi:prevent-host-death family protein
MYTREMSTPDSLSVSDARDQLASIINRARTNHEPVFLSRRGRRVAAVIDADDLERLIELAEDMTDIRAAEESREEMLRTKVEPTPWDEVKADLGLI